MITTPVLRRLVELACLAPSVHNTQPWRWHATDSGLRLYADRSRLLGAEDPLGRNLVISCGAALDHLRVAAGALGLSAEIVRWPSRRHGDLLAEISLQPGTPTVDAARDIALLRSRSTDRRRFTSWPVPDGVLDELAVTARQRGARAVAVADPSARFRLELLTQRAHLIRSLEPTAVEEQRGWVGRRTADGVPIAVLPAEPGPASDRFGPGLVRETRQLIESSDGIVAIGGDADDPPGWLLTGEALSSLWLQATREGLSVVPLSLPIEVEAVRDALHESVLDGVLLPHLLVRIGWQAIGRSDLPRTPRRPVSEVLKT